MNKKIIYILLFIISMIGLTSCSSTQKLDYEQVEKRLLFAESIDKEALLESLDSYEIDSNDAQYNITATKTFDASIFNEVDNVSLINDDVIIETNYNVEYDFINNIVRLNCSINANDEIIEVETIIGSTFYNDSGEIDAIFVSEGEEFLLSEFLYNINVCGWFTKALKIVASAVCVTAAVVAVVALAPIATTAMATAGIAVAVGTTTVGATIGISAGAAALVACVAGAVYLVADTAETLDWDVPSLNISQKLIEYTISVAKQIEKTKDKIYIAVPNGNKVFVSPFAITDSGARQVLRASTKYTETGIYTFYYQKAWQIAYDTDGAYPMGSNHSIADTFKSAPDNHFKGFGTYFLHFHPRYHSYSHCYFGLPL